MFMFTIIVKDEDWMDVAHTVSIEADDWCQARDIALDIAYELAGYTGFYTVYRAD